MITLKNLKCSMVVVFKECMIDFSSFLSIFAIDKFNKLCSRLPAFDHICADIQFQAEL